MRVLIAGSGGREHALAWKVAQSPQVEKIFIAPGNAGTALAGENFASATSREIVEWLKQNPMDLVIVGPDNYLADGLVDMMQALSIPVFGPTKAAAEIEWSKSFAKKLMQEEGIPTATSQTFTDYEKAKEYVREHPVPVVIKADGLALGKGVVIAMTHAEAELALAEMMQQATFGDAGKEVVIEEYLEGKEISIHAFSDGENVTLFPVAQDHKRIFDGDKGPNTGGMGTIAPVPWVTDELLEEIREKIVVPCIQGLKKRGRKFVGVLYPGIMVTADGPKVIEFNARFGDPETQSYLRLLKTDLVDICLACIEGRLAEIQIGWEGKSACCVAIASGGYPGPYEKGKIISGLDAKRPESIEVFHAGTAVADGIVVTNGGRVLGVTSVGNTLHDALSEAYKAIQSISFEGMQFRRDIGKKSI